MRLSAYESTEFECQVTGTQPVQVEWTRLNGEIGRNVRIVGPIIQFMQVEKSDEGSYRCSASNSYGTDTKILPVYVDNGRPVPRPPLPPQSASVVEIRPPSFSGEPGEEVKLSCTSSRSGSLEWSKENHVTLANHIYVYEGILIIRQATYEDSGKYICKSISPYYPPEISTVEVVIGSIVEPPRIIPLEKLYSIVQGHDLTLTCNVTGEPLPTVRWERVHEPIDSNTQQYGNVLRIVNAQLSNRGVYTCIGTTHEGSIQESTMIDIERK